MKKIVVIVFVFFQFAFLAEAQESLTAHELGRILYSPPDSANWFVVKNGIDERVTEIPSDVPTQAN